MFCNNVVGLLGNTIFYAVSTVMYVDKSTLPSSKHIYVEDASYFFIIYCNVVSTFDRIASDGTLLQ